ncbi:hypothetical protein RHMOL_Rhmol11G0265400 [Rhododendron molle]|uniref:Uncharacterized protein n=1 Tax=Rhododendron molle TaxID=49168 RepID=A0ACC0LXN8_RHOML|nr:hypothetical protein RHMOL_Rhmol11G0265400 [Rhododendron molle]
MGKGMIVSWVTMDEPGSSTVLYWSENSKLTNKFNTKYFYQVGTGQTTRTFWFTSPPEVGLDVLYTFGLIVCCAPFVGDLGQSYDSNKTLTHYALNPSKGKTVLFGGDLSCADNYPNHDNTRWDAWARAKQNPLSLILTVIMFPIKHRIVLLPFGKCTPQYQWLEAELPKVNRKETPWLIVLMHSLWYNSYKYHYMEGETMRVMYEPWFVQYKVDVVFAGHVHAYERSERVSNVAYNIVNGICAPVRDQSAPIYIYITIGDGGNIEGLATEMTDPQPKYSAFREASFGHANFDIKNRTHAYYSWHRNQDGYAVDTDSLWFFNQYWHPVDDSTTVK